MGDINDRAARISVRRYASASEADRDELRYWLQIPEAERVLEAWRLSVEQWRLRGEPPHEPGLCRSVARVHRR
jgi:Arc/MetJ-type ribon-helix-helix transcriptional regulator